MADYIRQLGYPARAHTATSSDVLHLPLTLLSGMGELSRIGELVLNPFLGPRFKTHIVTTDLPSGHEPSPLLLDLPPKDDKPELRASPQKLGP